jgi:hypothetical protein
MATLRYGETNHAPEVLDDAAGKTAAASGTCPACGGTNFQSVPHEELRKGGIKVMTEYHVCMTCRHLMQS